jgi:lipid II:glycine glycyltransferase (peptidoglycan interpeptide bridge formation enzyme)
MYIKPITENEQKAFNAVVGHPLQAYEWGEFREKTGVKVIRRGIFDGKKLISGFQLTIHKIPHTLFTIGYLPKGEMPTRELIGELIKIGREERCIFIQLEPNVRKDKIKELKFKNVVPAAHPLFTKYNFVLDLTPSEEDLLKNMHSKARYNIRVAQKHGVEVLEDNSDSAFKEYLRLTGETTKRQKFYAHTENYHKLMWSTLRAEATDEDKLTAHLFVARYQEKTLTSWVLFHFKDTLYYPYGASSSENREVMSSNLVMWEAIRYGKKMGLKKFDMWGALGPAPDTKDPWFGFHNFKEKYGPEHVEYIGSYDLIINPVLYFVYKLADKLRWLMLRFKK